MPAMELLCRIIGINSHQLSKQENLILEAEFFRGICDELEKRIRAQYNNYFRLMKFTAEMETTMIETAFIRCMINDILSTEEYSLPGIANYTHTPEDIIHEIASGSHYHPLLSLPRKIIELHRTVRAELYHEIIKKIIKD